MDASVLFLNVYIYTTTRAKDKRLKLTLFSRIAVIRAHRLGSVWFS